MSSNKYKVPTKLDISRAEINGFNDGLNGTSNEAYRYSGRDTLNASYIMAKFLGSNERMKLKNKKNKEMFRNENTKRFFYMQMKDRFLSAVVAGELGSVNEYGTDVKLSEFRVYFNDVKTDYVNSFLPAATLEKGRADFNDVKYLFRVGKGVYRVHPGVIEEYIDIMLNDGKSRSEIEDSTT